MGSHVNILYYPDLPILAFFVFLAFFRFAVFLAFFVRFCLSFPRISRVQPRGKSLLFRGILAFFAKRSKDWRVRVEREREREMHLRDALLLQQSLG